MRRALYILADLDDGDLTWLAAQGSQRRLTPGEVVIREGEVPEFLSIVIDGALEVMSGRTRVAELGPGDIVGEMSLIEKRAPSVSVRASAAACRLLCVPQSVLAARLARDPGFAARFYRALAVFLSDRLRATMASLGYGKPDGESRRAALERENELDEGLLDTLHVAGDRMRRLIAMLEGRQPF